MKTFLGIILLIISVIIGYFLSKKYTERREFFFQLKGFNESVKKEVLFSKNTIIELVKKLTPSGKFNNYIKAFFAKESDLESYLDCLKLEERQYLSNYLSGLGNGDAEEQKKYIESSQADIDKMYTEAFEAEKKYRPLCIKLGFLFGLILLIIML